MGSLFVSEKLVDDISASVDSSMLKAAGSSMAQIRYEAKQTSNLRN